MLSGTLVTPPASPATMGILRMPSAHGVGETVDRLVELIAKKGLKLFARIDFSADAAAAGLALKPEQLVIFGNPKSGTALLQASPSVGLDLPIKALVFEDAQGATWLAYNDPGYVVARHGIPAELANNIAGVAALFAQATGAQKA